MSISAELLKQSHLKSQMLLGPRLDYSIQEIVDKLGYIQVDPISAVARSHHLVPHSRSTAYTIGNIWDIFNAGEMFEWFSHARCLLPAIHFRYYYRKMLKRREIKPKWFKKNNPKKLIADVLEYIRDNGPILPQNIDLEVDLDVSTGWSSPLKRIVNYLTLRGYILTVRRENFQPYVDVIERVVDIPDDIPDRLEAFWFDITTSLKANGPSMLHRILHYNYNQRAFMYEGEKIRPRALLKNWIKKGKLIEIDVEGIKYPFYGTPNQIDDLENSSWSDEKFCRLLSPFDNALWSREDLLRQYRFDYKMEIYVPKSQRKYGYYALPILYGTQFVGRVDVKLHRTEQLINYKQWSWEPDFNPTNSFWDALVDCLEEFNQFHHVLSYSFDGIQSDYLNQIETRLSLDQK